MNATQLEWAMADRDRFMNRIYSRDSRPHFPNLVISGSGRRDLLNADRQLMEILKLLTARSGNPNPMIDQDLVVEQIMRDHELLAYFSNDLRYIASSADEDKRATVKKIVEEYLDQFRMNGIVGFMSTVISAIVTRFPFEEWTTKAAQLMREAFESGENSLEQYWAKNAERIWGTKFTVDMRNKGGGGTPVQSGQSGSPGAPAAGGTDNTPQAKSVIIDGFEAADEVSSLPPQTELFWANQQQVLNPAIRNDMAVQPYPFNIAPVSGAMTMMMPMIGGLKTILN